jgi:hypothetical protein
MTDHRIQKTACDELPSACLGPELIEGSQVVESKTESMAISEKPRLGPHWRPFACSGPGSRF